MSHSTLEIYYKNMFNLVHLHKFASLTELESMIPFELEVYMALIREDIEVKQEAANQQRLMQEAMSRRRY